MTLNVTKEVGSSLEVAHCQNCNYKERRGEGAGGKGIGEVFGLTPRDD